MTKKLSILFITSLVLISIITISRNPIIGKFIIGSARIIGKETQSEIYINGKKKVSAKIFISKSNFAETDEREYIILYLREVNDFKGNPVLIIDKKNKTVCISNASRRDYNLVFGNLFQSESGANVMVPINDPNKGAGFEPDLRINKNLIRFKVIDDKKLYEIIINIA